MRKEKKFKIQLQILYCFFAAYGCEVSFEELGVPWQILSFELQVRVRPHTSAKLYLYVYVSANAHSYNK